MAGVGVAPEAQSGRARGVTHSVERGLAAEHGDDVVRAFEYQVEVAAVSAGETVEHLKSLRIENPDGERLELHERCDGDVRLEPRSRHLESLRVERTHLGLAKGFRAVAELASGVEVSSDQQLDQRVLMDAKTRQD